MRRRAPARILVVDDNHLIRRLLELILEAAGHECVGAECGEAALGLAVADPPDLFVVDEVMPGMRGSELIRALRASRCPGLARLPIVGVSGRAGAARDLLAAGADDFVPKPIEERALLQVVARALAGGRPTADHPPGPRAP